jgi:hypothetical protein
MKNAVFWDVAPCRSCVNRRFVGSHKIYTAPHPTRNLFEYLSVHILFRVLCFIIFLRRNLHGKCRDSAVGIATGWTTEGSEFESRWGQEFLLFGVVPTGSGVHPTSYPMGTGGSSSRIKRPGREADHSPPTSAEVKKTWIYTSTPTYAFKA